MPGPHALETYRNEKSLLDRALSLFTDVRAGEGATAVLMLINIFVLLICYSVIKTVREPLILPKGRATLTLLLPVGSEAGAYEVQVLDAALTSRASGSGSASIDNFVTTLRTTLDLTSVGEGPYQLAIRRSGQEWQLFPARMR